jgi:hypothetical protein
MLNLKALLVAFAGQLSLGLLAPHLIDDQQSQRFATHGALSVGLIAWTYFKDSQAHFRRSSFWAIFGACLGLLPPLVSAVIQTAETHLVSVAGVFAVVAYTRMASFFGVNAYQGAFSSFHQQQDLSRVVQFAVCAFSAVGHWALCSLM